MRKQLTRSGAVLLLCLGLALAGCGGGDDSSNGTTAAQSGGAAPAQGQASKQPSSPAKKGGSGRSEQGSSSGSAGGSGSESGSGSSTVTPAPGDTSIQHFGSAAESEQEAEISDAMRSFFLALVKPDYKKICADISSGNRMQLQQYAKYAQKKNKDVPSSCEGVLKTLLPGQGKTAREHAKGKVQQVRVKGTDAFVLYHAPGARLYYFVMKKEGDSWKATSLTTGSVLVP